MAYGNEFVVNNEKYRMGDDVGSGGNGVVFELKRVDGGTKNEFVVKQLRDDFGSKQVTEQRKKRFQKEIETVLNIQDEIVGILPIIVASLKEDDVWYIMPKAKRCMQKIRQYKNIQNKIEILLQIANTIKELH